MRETQPIQAGNILAILFFLILILVGAYFATKAVARLSMRQSGKKRPAARGRRVSPGGRYLSIVDRLSIDRDKSILLVEFNGKLYFLGASPEGVRVLDKTDAPPQEEPPEKEQEAATPPPSNGDMFHTFCGNLKRAWRLRYPAKKREVPKEGAFDSELKRQLMDQDDKHE